MDRLVIESALSDVNEIFLSGVNDPTSQRLGIVLGFKAANIDQVLNAFTGLKDIVCDKEVLFVICQTRMAGIYDLEIKTEGLDEPIRIMNKAIDNETLGGIEDKVNSGAQIILTTNVSEDDNMIELTQVLIKACNEVA
ncbi:MAG: hypothetical protein WKF66_08770 [Pedobacter sp.]